MQRELPARGEVGGKSNGYIYRRKKARLNKIDLISTNTFDTSVNLHLSLNVVWNHAKTLKLSSPN
jgi:hypothetical protein